MVKTRSGAGVDRTLASPKFKLIGNNRGNFPYRIGLNRLVDNGETFNPRFVCGPGALYYTDAAHIFEFVEYGHQLCVVYAVDDAQVIKMDNKWKTDQLWIESRRALWTAETIRWLIKQGADVHIGDDWALRWAASGGYLSIVQLLVTRYGADLHALDDDALCSAADKGHFIVVQWLVDHGANVHAQRDKAINLAAINGHVRVVQYLSKHGANITTHLEQRRRLKN